MRYMVWELDYRDPTAPTIKYTYDKYGNETRHEIPSTRPLTNDLETGLALSALDEAPQLVRMLLEQNDWYVELDNRYRIRKVIRQRNPECLQGQEDAETNEKLEALAEDRYKAYIEDALNQESTEQLTAVSVKELGALAEHNVSEEEEEEDILLSEETSTSEGSWSAPKEKFDLIYWADAPQPNETKGFSAPLFPTIRWKGKLSGAARINGKIYSYQKILQRLTSRLIFDTDLMDQQLFNRLCKVLPSWKARARATELRQIEEFFRNKKKQETAKLLEEKQLEEVAQENNSQKVQELNQILETN